ncbi:hypothetical protein [Phycicoccus sp.]|jgi:hypothetical protein|uniref:hypothetical protein n=1 Tax=Phycicoccus sp. TaxID=1902410 RepID=UPI002BB59DD9|nr:hypothetical protein [Phycicoccus sp.]HMM95249.1 hypothetical protein [Phycicoccus sp.]
MWWIIALLAVVVVLGVLLDRRRRGSGSSGDYTGDAPYGAEAAAARTARQSGPGMGGGGS